MTDRLPPAAPCRVDALKPPPQIGQLRASHSACPFITRNGDSAFLVLRYQDVVTVLADRSVSRSALSNHVRIIGIEQGRDSLLDVDGADHRRMRGLLASGLTGSVIDRAAAVAHDSAEACLDAIVGVSPPPDLIPELVEPVIRTVLFDMLGVPEPDRETVLHACRDIGRVDNLAVSESGARATASYFKGLIRSRANCPRNDLLGNLITAHEKRPRAMTEAQFLTLLTTLLIGGYDTTRSALGKSIAVLLGHPTEYRRISVDGALAEAATDEALRLVSPANTAFPRVALADLTLTDGTIVPAGSLIVASLVSANRDENRFPEADRFLSGRRPHVAFGHGHHYCPGAPLARVTLRSVLRVLSRRLPNLALAQANLRWHDEFMAEPLVSLPVYLEAR